MLRKRNLGGDKLEKVFDEYAMRDMLRRKHLTIEGWAKKLGVSKTTLYRKISGESDFWRSEIQSTCEYVNEENLSEIFFANKVT